MDRFISETIQGTCMAIVTVESQLRTRMRSIECCHFEWL